MAYGELVAELGYVLGDERLAAIAGAAAPFAEHAPACPCVETAVGDVMAVYTAALETLEVALESQETPAEAAAALGAALEPHRRAGCFGARVAHWANASEVEAAARVLVHQLRAALLAAAEHRRPGDEPNAVLTFDELVDYEAQFRLESVRAAPSTEAFDVGAAPEPAYKRPRAEGP